ncbi:hypothetical protein [Crossiella cryophila]|uniref:Uncharacterized protein n=1 Tax=Crossiella cryophila TaxID=43355 RepID=A0A7W7FVH1_9PSEU|nr:hypothetical protein [Crossiella cryophila]MBB4678488.1 hypothetical protein [Crossiella cryophila]
MHAERFTAAPQATIRDPELRALPLIGAIDQFVASTDALGDRIRTRRLGTRTRIHDRVRTHDRTRPSPHPAARGSRISLIGGLAMPIISDTVDSDTVSEGITAMTTAPTAE